MNELEKWLKRLLYGIKHETLCNDDKVGGLKNVDIPNKIMALHWSWIRRLYDDSFYECKLIPLYLIQKSLGTSFKFHSNLLFKSNKTKFFPSFYREIILNWKKHLAMTAKVPSCALFQYVSVPVNICVTIKVSRWIKPPFIF